MCWRTEGGPIGVTKVAAESLPTAVRIECLGPGLVRSGGWKGFVDLQTLDGHGDIFFRDVKRGDVAM